MNILTKLKLHYDYWHLDSELRNLTVEEELLMRQPDTLKRSKKLADVYLRIAYYYAQRSRKGPEDFSVWENIYVRMANAQRKKANLKPIYNGNH